MKFISLIDIKNQNIITIDSDNLILKIEIDDNIKETRIKAYTASILYALFSNHPKPASYEQITDILKQHNLVISDMSRMHRKLSEIRQCIAKFHLSLKNIIFNTRGIGYCLPMSFRNLHQTEKDSSNIKFSNQKLENAVEILRNLINDAIDITAQVKVMKCSQGYIINRDDKRDHIIENISTFNECKRIILKEIRAHEVDFTTMRIEYSLAKLKTYVGLARISEYPILEAQWLDWFTQEIWLLFEELKKLIRFAISPT